MKKRIVSFLMALVMTVSLLPVSAFAVEDAASSDAPAVEAPEVQPAEVQQDEDADKPAVQDSSEEPKDITISFEKTGLPSGSYTSTITDTITANGKTITTTYLVDANANDTISWHNATGSSLRYRKCHFLKTKGITWSSDETRAVSDSALNGIEVTEADLVGAGFTKGSFTASCLKYYFMAVESTNTYGILVQVGKPSGEPIDKTALNTEIAKVTGENATNWHQSDDRYNGKITSETGFWAEMQPALTKAQNIANAEGGNQTAIDDATAALQTAIANLIPATQLNATALYEAVQQYSGTGENSRYSEESLKNKTTATANAFKAARSDAEEYLAKLFDENGDPTAENVAANQSKADGYVTALKEAAEGLVDKVNAYVQPDFDNAVSGIRLYSKLYDPEKLTESNYTADSWAAYKAAYDAAQAALKKAPVFNTEMPGTVVNEITEAFSDFRNACHGLVETKSQITVTISLTDKYAVQKNANSIATVTSRVTLTPGATVGDTLAKLGVTAPSVSGFVDTCAYINGVQCYSIASAGLNGGTVSSPNTYVNLGLHDGDEVVIAKIYPKIYSNISELDMPCAPNMVVDYLKHQRITTSLTDNRVKAGESFTVTVTAANAMPSQRTGSYSPVSGAALYMGAANADQSAAEKAPITTNLQVSTNASGQATVTLYESGWCLLYAYDLTENGAYTNGAATLIYVEPTDDLAAIRAKLADELTAVAKDPNYPESYFLPDDWSAIQTAYTDALAAIQNAETAEAARTAQLAAMGTIRAKQSAADEYNVNNLASFRNYLNSLPEDLTKLDKSAESTIKSLIQRYEQMTGYQRDQLMKVEQNRYDAIKAAYDKGLKDAVQYQLKVEYDLSAVPEADRAGLQAMIQWLKENTTRDGWNGDLLGNTQMAELFSFNNVQSSLYNVNYTQVTSATAGSSIYFCDNPAYAAFMHMKAGRTKDRDGKTITDAKASYPMMVDGNEYAIADGVWQIEDMQAQGKASVSADGLRYTVNGHAYVLRGITYSGVTSEVRDWAFDVFDFSNYMGRNEIGTTNYKAVTILHSFKSITMPYNDVTVTITWAPEGGTDDELSAAKTAAISRLDALKNSLSGDGVDAAYDAGVKAIQAATSVSGVENAYQAAVKNMQAAASYGKVRVIVENTTFPKADWGRDTYWYGEAVNTEVQLTADSTMMSCIVDALEQYGYSQTGAENNYISSITVDGYRLGEFGGGDKSGWMGTLNDWFTNEGFGGFSVANGKLSNGDVIRVMYTRDLGVDLGGTWGNSDTTLKSLDVKGGKLLTEFTSGEAGGSYEYVLQITGDTADIQLTPTAANKNYLTKIFLNEKVTTDDEGLSFYKRTETIPVKDGDVIYIGCGEKAWPSMNKQGAEAREYQGTWYALRVVNINKGAGSVESMIDELPDASEVRYSDYPSIVDAVAAARAAYDALSKSEQSKVSNEAKLKELETVIEGYQAIDDVKDKLDKLPSAGDLTIKDRDAVKAAKDAYDKLTDEQKEYLSVGQVKKLDEVTSRMDEIIKKNPDSKPDKKPSQSTTGKDVKSGNTGDAGITLYLGMGLVAVLAGAVVITRKRKEN